MKHYLSNRSLAPTGIITRLAILVVFSTAIAPSAVFGQATLQNTSSGLQSQSPATQQSINTQNQTGTLQNNNPSTLLNQSSNVPLGVVSTPRQAEPEAVAQPSTSLKTDITKPKKTNKLPMVLAICSLVIALAGAYWLFRNRSGQAAQAGLSPQKSEIVMTKIPVEKPTVRPEPQMKPKKHKVRGSRRKRKKSRQR